LDFYCYRHLLEVLGSRTFVAMLARRLLFTYTKQEFRDVVDQIMCDFQAGCREGLITRAAEKKCRALFEIGPRLSLEVSRCRLHALGGDRGSLCGFDMHKSRRGVPWTIERGGSRSHQFAQAIPKDCRGHPEQRW
jgi:hypothetical protein